ncbi:MAG: MauE/DoxX family redox-associated membrane protein [Desulfatibacillaceae bacterium]|nr:MauE/DoxX family redox-associated membrane protein [Desulfatibacillaceae bacterium]
MMLLEEKRPKGLLFMLARLVLGGVFIYASLDKIVNPADFARAVYFYQLLPDSLINIVAIILPWLELFMGICIISGIWLPGAVLLANVLLWSFFAALVFNTARGLDVHCGCFSTRPDPAAPPPTLWYFVRDPIFLLVAGYLAFRVYMEPKNN